MRLGSKTDDEFLIKLNEKNNQIQNKFQKSLPGIQKKGDYITSLVIILTRVGMVDDALTQKQVKIIHSFFRKNLDFGAAVETSSGMMIVANRYVSPGILRPPVNDLILSEAIS